MGSRKEAQKAQLSAATATVDCSSELEVPQALRLRRCRAETCPAFSSPHRRGWGILGAVNPRRTWRPLASFGGPFILLAMFLAGGPTPAPAAEPGAAPPLYLLTYDHGGLILWGRDQFAERLRNAMTWLDRYPGFKIGLDNEAYLYDDLAEHDPALLEELRADLRRYAGRFGIGSSTYGQPLTTFLNGESNIRQITYAVRTEQRQLSYSPVIYLMSEHAMHSQTPQILVGCGFRGALLRTHFMMYGYNPTFDLPIGWWVGLDGSRLPAVPTYPGEGAAFGRTTLDNWFLTRYPGPEARESPEDFRRRFAHLQPLLASRADDAGLRKEALVQQCAGNPAYRWVLLDELLELFPKPTAEMRTGPDDFTVRMPWGFCGNEIWDRNRQAEVEVLEAERLAALAVRLGDTNHEAELERAWKNLLVGQHHDIQIVGLLPEARRFLGASLTASSHVLTRALQFVAARLQGDGLSQVTLFNPLSWPRTEWIETDLAVGRGVAKTLEVCQGNRVLPSVLLRADRSASGFILDARLAFRAELPALAVTSFSIRSASTNRQLGQALTLEPTSPPPRVEVDPANLTIVTPGLEARLDPHGGIASLVDRGTGAAWFRPGVRSGFFAGRIDGQEAESHGRWTVHPAAEKAPWVLAREDGFIATIPYTLEIRFAADTVRLDCRASFHFAGEKIGQVSNDPRDGRSAFVHEDKLRFKFFPAVGPQATGVRDLPFAVAATTNRYVQGLYWTALADHTNGVAVFNRGTMGAVRERDGGFSLPLAFAMYYVWGTRMLTGDFTYEFALYPFRGDWPAADLQRRALAYNFPLVQTQGPPGDGSLGNLFQPWRLGSDHILLSALYPARGQVYARLFEDQGRPGETAITARNGSLRLQATDLLERGDETASNPLRFHPWQFRTFRIDPGP